MKKKSANGTRENSPDRVESGSSTAGDDVVWWMNVDVQAEQHTDVSEGSWEAWPVTRAQGQIRQDQARQDQTVAWRPQAVDPVIEL